MMHGAEGRSGFTLAELLVVLVILGVVAATALPAYSRTSPDALTAAADDVTRLLRSTERMALDLGTRVRLTLVPGTHAYAIEQVSDTSVATLGAGTLALAEGVAFADERPSIRLEFGRTGVLAPDSLVLRTNVAARIVRIDAWTGTIGGAAR